MTDAVITEFAGMRGGSINRIYQYTREGIRVLNGRRVLKRLYLFDPSTNMMRECDISRQDKVLRRFVFDNYGMLEESFSFGHPPRTFRYEDGGRQIVMREGGDYGAVGKTYTFEANGIAETAYGRNGEIERVFVFASGNDTILLRRGGWYGDVERTMVFEGIEASLFREPEAFLQFLMFTEQSHEEQEAEVQEQVAKIRGETPSASGRSRYAYTGVRHTSMDTEERPEQSPAMHMPVRPEARQNERPARRPTTGAFNRDDAGIEIIPDGDASPQNVPRGNPAEHEHGDRIPFDERWKSGQKDDDELTQGGNSRISFEERWQSAQPEAKKLNAGRSTQISYEERKTGRRMQ
jgi:hypothetical protein